MPTTSWCSIPWAHMCIKMFWQTWQLSKHDIKIYMCSGVFIINIAGIGKLQVTRNAQNWARQWLDMDPLGNLGSNSCAYNQNMCTFGPCPHNSPEMHCHQWHHAIRQEFIAAGMCWNGLLVLKTILCKWLLASSPNKPTQKHVRQVWERCVGTQLEGIKQEIAHILCIYIYIYICTWTCAYSTYKNFEARDINIIITSAWCVVNFHWFSSECHSNINCCFVADEAHIAYELQVLSQNITKQQKWYWPPPACHHVRQLWTGLQSLWHRGPPSACPLAAIKDGRRYCSFFKHHAFFTHRSCGPCVPSGMHYSKNTTQGLSPHGFEMPCPW